MFALSNVLTTIILATVVPFVLIYFVNTMFDVSNPYDFEHWLAAEVWLGCASGIMLLVHRQ